MNTPAVNPSIDLFPECCIEGQGARDKNGYIRLAIGSSKGNANRFGLHRVIYRAFIGPIPAGMVVMHTCDNPPCINPRHLRVGTHTDNMRDMTAKRRLPFGERHYAAKLTAEQVVQIRAAAAPHSEIAKRFGITKSAVTAIRGGRTWANLGGGAA